MLWISSFRFILLALYTLPSTAAPAKQQWTTHLHERRNAPPQGWIKRSKVPTDTILPVRIALAQSNMHLLEQHLLSVSTPGLPDYGKHWTPEKIADTFAPSEESVDVVKEWLVESGMKREGIERSGNGGWLHFNASVEAVEGLLESKYWVWENEGGVRQVACEKYFVPE